MPFTEQEIDYLAERRLGRLATVAPDGQPHNRPVLVHYNSELATIDVVGHALVESRKFRNAEAYPLVSFVVDDLPSVQPWRTRGIEIRGRAEALRGPGASPFGDEAIRIHPTRILTWGLDPDRPGTQGRDVS